ncbi:transposase IS200 family protein, partial [Nitrosospira multiformis]
ARSRTSGENLFCFFIAPFSQMLEPLQNPGRFNVHILTSCPPSMAPSEIMRRIKGRTSSKLFEEFPHLKKKYWGKHFWARGYFCATVGQMTEEMIKQYLEHHFEPRPDDDFKIESD